MTARPRPRRLTRAADRTLTPGRRRSSGRPDQLDPSPQRPAVWAYRSWRPWGSRTPTLLQGGTAIDWNVWPLFDSAVRLGLPLGVARVLVADLATDGYVTCTEPAELSIDIIA